MCFNVCLNALAAQAIPPIPTHFAVAWSVFHRSVTIVHPTKPFDLFRWIQ